MWLSNFCITVLLYFWYVIEMNDIDDEEKVVTAWHTAFKTGTDYDLWGQPVEAIEDYQRYI